MSQLGIDPRELVRFSDWVAATWLAASPSVALCDLKHGDLSRWLAAIDSMPQIPTETWSYGRKVAIGRKAEVADQSVINDALEALVPWRKGPFALFGCDIDAEWRSDMKWDRLSQHVSFADASVIDIGCGNGYYAFRMLGRGARSILGFEQNLLYALQAMLFVYYTQARICVLPIRYTSAIPSDSADVVVSMGVLYHQSNPQAHLRDAYHLCHYKSEFLLETLIADTDIRHPQRYANMKNVSLIPSIDTITFMLSQAGFNDVQLIDVNQTTQLEQRRTKWMPFYSLEQALCEDDINVTVEGLPAPKRAIFLARK